MKDHIITAIYLIAVGEVALGAGTFERSGLSNYCGDACEEAHFLDAEANADQLAKQACRPLTAQRLDEFTRLETIRWIGALATAKATYKCIPRPSVPKIECQARVLTSLCGSGVVQLSTDRDFERFRLAQGDVTCWFSGFSLDGMLEQVDSPDHLRQHNTYRMITESRHEEIGNLTIGRNVAGAPTLAQLVLSVSDEMIENGSAYGRYSLICPDNPVLPPTSNKDSASGFCVDSCSGCNSVCVSDHSTCPNDRPDFCANW